MKYADGRAIEVGDRADLGGGMTGVVVAVIGQGRYSMEYPEKEWGFLREGILVDSLEAGLIHYAEDNSHRISLLTRRT